jgi:hypothetical protein
MMIEVKDAGGMFPCDEILELDICRNSTVQEESVTKLLIARTSIRISFRKIEIEGETSFDWDVGILAVTIGSASLIDPRFISELR